MRRLITLAIVCLLVAGSAYLGFTATAAEQEKAKPAKVEPKGESKGEQVTITGQLSCTFCKLAHPAMTCTPECCMSCTKVGDPPMLTAADGNMYLLLTGKMGEALMNPERTKMLGGQVTVKGLLVKGKGIQAIYVDSMEKVEVKKAEEKKP
jgi:hypothetical protein